MGIPGEEAVASLIGDIYQAAYDFSAWQTVVDGLRSLFHGSKACMGCYGPGVSPENGFYSNTDPAYNRMNMTGFDADEHVSALAALPNGVVYRDHALIGQDRLRATRFWNEWMAPQDMFGAIGVKLLTAGPASWLIDVNRGARQEPFDDTEIAALEMLAPHFRRAVTIGHNLQMSDALSEAFFRLPFGIVVVSSDRRVVTMNAVAEEILRRPGSPLCSKADRLYAADIKADEELGRLVGNACPANRVIASGLGGDFLIRPQERDEPASSLFVSVGPLLNGGRFLFEPCAVIAIREREIVPSPAILKGLYGLTPGEVRLAAALARGQPLKAAALSSGLTYRSARTYLERIFAKTGVHSQPELVALLASTYALR